MRVVPHSDSGYLTSKHAKNVIAFVARNFEVPESEIKITAMRSDASNLKWHNVAIHVPCGFNFVGQTKFFLSCHYATPASASILDESEYQSFVNKARIQLSDSAANNNETEISALERWTSKNYLLSEGGSITDFYTCYEFLMNADGVSEAFYPVGGLSPNHIATEKKNMFTLQYKKGDIIRVCGDLSGAINSDHISHVRIAG